jgi:hypothetical protein
MFLLVIHPSVGALWSLMRISHGPFPGIAAAIGHGDINPSVRTSFQELHCHKKDCQALP